MIGAISNQVLKGFWDCASYSSSCNVRIFIVHTYMKPNLPPPPPWRYRKEPPFVLGKGRVWLHEGKNFHLVITVSFSVVYDGVFNKKCWIFKHSGIFPAQFHCNRGRHFPGIQECCRQRSG